MFPEESLNEFFYAISIKIRTILMCLGGFLHKMVEISKIRKIYMFGIKVSKLISFYFSFIVSLAFLAGGTFRWGRGEENMDKTPSVRDFGPLVKLEKEVIS